MTVDMCMMFPRGIFSSFIPSFPRGVNHTGLLAYMHISGKYVYQATID